MSGKKAPVREPRPGQAVELFERAMKAIGKRDFEKARELLATLQKSHPDERDILERARAYVAICDRALAPQTAYKPRGFDEHLHYGVFLHNRGDYEGAQKALRHALELRPQDAHALYCLAAAAARGGDSATAVKSLRAAAEKSADIRAQVRLDPDFDGLRQEPEFLALFA